MHTELLIDTSVQQGIIYSFAVIGVYISFRVLNFPDLTVDGSFTLGAAIYAKMITANYPTLICMPVSWGAGFLAGIITASLNRKFGISKILSGILVMLMLYSINLRVMGKANISLLQLNNLISNSITTTTLFLFLCGFIVIVFYGFVTRLALIARGSGDNEYMVAIQGINTDVPVFLGIGFANGLVAISGALVADSQGFADVNMGTGIIIVTLASLIIGEAFIELVKKICPANSTNFIRFKLKWYALLPYEIYFGILASCLGACLYFGIITTCLQFDLAPTDLKLATSIFVIIGIAIKFNKYNFDSYIRGRL